MPTTPRRNILCILAGGESKRFGSSKLYVHIGGEPILSWQVRRLLGGVGGVMPGKAEAWISLSPEERMTLPGITSFEHRIADSVKHGGPMAAIWNVLERAHPGETVAFVPADMPLLEGQHLTGLARLLVEAPDAAIVMCKWIDGPNRGRVEPLPSIWRALPALNLRKRLGPYDGPSRLADLEGVVCAGLEHERDSLAWKSINRREDLKTIERALGKEVTAPPPSPPRRGCHGTP